jgi:Flp pilus assembly protein TadG
MIGKKFIKNEKGQVVIIVALFLVAFVGMVALTIDVGSIYQERRHVQTTADSAALAGAQDLPENPGEAIQKAIDYAGFHGVTITDADIEISETYVPHDTIRVNPRGIDAELFFAPVLNINSATVNAVATAVAGGPLFMDNLMPWTVPLEDYEPIGLLSGEPYDMKVGPHAEPSTPGWFQAMRFDGPGANQYRENIVEGCEEDIYLNEYYPVEPGNMAGPTGQGVNERIGTDTCTFDEVTELVDGRYVGTDGDCPRIVYVPLVEERPENPSEDVLIVEFAIFFIESVESSGHGGNAVTTVTGRYMDSIIAVSSGDITGYSGGIKIIRLIE